MSILKKLANNFFSGEAFDVLGRTQYAFYLAGLALKSPAIIETKSLQSLDKFMGKISRQFYFKGHQFMFDCHFCDSIIEDETYAFGAVREIYIRNCYFKHLPPKTFEKSKTVIDLGANRGAFSTLMAGQADFVLSVEACSLFRKVIQHQMCINQYNNNKIETCFLGTGGYLKNPYETHITIPELLDKYNIQQVDLMKMDIEGSEFALFENCDWLQKVSVLTMEVHPEHGKPEYIKDKLEGYGFLTKLANDDLQLLNTGDDADFLYAWKPDFFR